MPDDPYVRDETTGAMMRRSASERVLRVGIASVEEMKARTLAIARGEHRPSPDEPKVWFTSMESLAQVLSSKNHILLELIAQAEPACPR